MPKCHRSTKLWALADALQAKIRAVAEELDAYRNGPPRRASETYADADVQRSRKKLGIKDVLDEDDERIKREGLVLILKELHDKLDALVFEAYGWLATLSDEDILERLVALNKERAEEEKAGKVRWLRPDHQIPRFDSEAEQAALKAAEDENRKASQTALDLEEGEDQDAKPKYPTGDELAETTAVLHALAIWKRKPVKAARFHVNAVVAAPSHQPVREAHVT